MTLSANLTADAAAAAALEQQVASLQAQVAALTNPAPSIPLNHQWGIAGNSGDVLYTTGITHALDMAAAAKAAWVRVDFDWSGVEAVQGSMSWGTLDAFVAAANQRGIKVVATLAYTPAWARPAGTTNKTPPTNPGDFANFARAAAARYGPLGVHVYEVWNEPNLAMFWSPKVSPSAYTALLRQAYTAIHGADPQALVLSGGLAPAGDDTTNLTALSPRTFLTQMYAAGLHGSFDAFAIHPYAYNYGIDAVGPWNQWQSLPQTQAILASNGDGAMKVWATEYGAPTGGGSKQIVTEAVQAQYVTAAWAEWTDPAKFGAWTGPLLWYCLRDTGTDKTNAEQNFGLYRNDYSAKPSLAAFQGLPR